MNLFNKSSKTTCKSFIILAMMTSPAYAQEKKEETNEELVIFKPRVEQEVPVSKDTPVIEITNSQTSTITKVQNAHYKAAYELTNIRAGGTALSPRLVLEMRNQIFLILKKRPDIITLEEDYPGILNAGLDEMLPVLIRQINDNLPDLFDRQTKALKQNFSLLEIRKLKKILISPTIKRIRLASQSNLDGSAFADVIESERDINANDIQQFQIDTAANIMPKLSDADNKYLLKIGQDPLFKKFMKFKPELDKIEAIWSNESTPEEDLKTEEAATRGFENHIAKFKDNDEGE